MALKVEGCCPACGYETLTTEKVRGTIRRLTCTNDDCPRPDATHEILKDSNIHHIVTIEPETFSLKHPLWERVDDQLLECDIWRLLASRRRPVEPGTYQVWNIGGQLKFEEVVI